MNAVTKISEPPPARMPGPQTGVELYRVSTDAAEVCKKIVVATAKKIGDRNYVCVEGWQALSLAHGCVASSGDVTRHPDGSVSAIGRIIRIADGALISSAEGYVGADEPTWFGGTVRRWKWGEQRGQKVWYEDVLPKRPDYAIRAMAQTRAISRACRSAFAHVVVMMNAGLSTTPAEEVPDAGFDNQSPPVESTATQVETPRETPREPSPRETAKPKVSIKDWLTRFATETADALAAKDADAIRAILNREDVKLARANFKNDAAGRLDDLLASLVAALPVVHSEPDFLPADDAGKPIGDDEIPF